VCVPLIADEIRVEYARDRALLSNDTFRNPQSGPCIFMFSNGRA
jgi:hypothetical protein